MAAALCWQERPPLPHNCTICRHDEDKRKEWGCDDDLDEVPEELQFDCLYCYVEPLHGINNRIDPDCHMCEGRGWWGPTRCPRKLVGTREMAICESAGLFVELGALPRGGGIRDYPAVFNQAINVVLKERAAYQEQAREEARTKNKTGAK